MRSLTATNGHVLQLWTLSELASSYDMPAHPQSYNHANEARSYPERLSRENGAAWMCGITTRKQASDLLARGWEDGARRLQDMTCELTPPTVLSRRRKPMWRDEGDELSVDRALAGQWDAAWRSSRRVWCAGPTTVTLLTYWGGNARVTADQLFWQGAAAAVLCDVLEEAGYRVQLIAGSTTIGLDGKGTSFVVVKNYDEPMRIDATSSVLCHAGIFRSFGLRATCFFPFDIGYGHGRCESDWPSSTVDALRTTGEWPEDAIVLGKAYSRSECMAEIERVIKEIERT